MAVSDDLRKRINAALLLAESGRIDSAEQALLESIDELGDDEAALKGKLYINLGSLTQDIGRAEDAFEYYSDALEQLEGLKGESILQSAHACFNVARILLQYGAEEAAPAYATLALQYYRQYPLTPPADLLDAEILEVNCQIYAAANSENPFPKTPSEIESLWESILPHQFDSLTRSEVLRFLLVYLPMKKQIDPDGFEKERRRLEEWADRDFVNEVHELMKQAPGLVLLSPTQE